MTTPTLSPKDAAYSLEELAEHHESGACCGDLYSFTIDQLSDLIKEVIGKPICYWFGSNQEVEFEVNDSDRDLYVPLHAIDMRRLK